MESGKQDQPKEQQPYSINWTGPARRALKGIRRDMHSVIVDAVGALATNPRPEGVKKLSGEYADTYQIRVTIHYRVHFTIDDNARHIEVVLVGPREAMPY